MARQAKPNHINKLVNIPESLLVAIKGRAGELRLTESELVSVAVASYIGAPLPLEYARIAPSPIAVSAAASPVPKAVADPLQLATEQEKFWEERILSQLEKMGGRREDIVMVFDYQLKEDFPNVPLEEWNKPLSVRMEERAALQPK